MSDRTHKFWSMREVALLETRHDICTPTELAALTGHSIHAVYSKLRSLKLVLTERHCRGCGDMFIPTHRGHIYCSKSCGHAAFDRRILTKERTVQFEKILGTILERDKEIMDTLGNKNAR